MPSGVYIRTKEHNLSNSNARKGKKRKPFTAEHLANMSKVQKGQNNPNFGKKEEKSHLWKGNKAGLEAIHSWVIRHKGKASSHPCVDCGKQARDWSNIDHTYKRVLEDYSARCRSCHSIFDIMIQSKEREVI